MYTFVGDKSFGQLLYISPRNFIFLKTFNCEFSYIEVRFTNQNSEPLERQDKINITLVIYKIVKHKSWWDIQFNLEIKYLWQIKDFYILVNILVEIKVNNWVVNISKIFLIMLNNLWQMHLNLLLKSHSKNSRSKYWFDG